MTRKKRIWRMLSVMTLTILLMAVIYSCGGTKEKESRKTLQKSDTPSVAQREDDLNAKEETEMLSKQEEAAEANEKAVSSDNAKFSANESDAKKSDTNTETTSTKEPTSNNQTKEEDSSTESTTTKQDTHTHTWVKQTKTVEHEASGHYEQVLVKEAWTEVLPTYDLVPYEACNACGEDITTDIYAHTKAHSLKGEPAGHHTEYRQVQIGKQTIYHEAEYENRWVVEEAWTETIVTGYRCSCGTTK